MMDRARRLHDHPGIDWERHMRKMAMLGVMAVLMLMGPSVPWAAETVAGNGVQQHAESPTFVGRCALWDEAAGWAIAQRAQATPDVNVHLVSDSVAGMRRARRLCALGSLADACLEYDAVISGVQRRLQAGAMPPMCRSVATDAPAS
jgi:hypothetical protein